MEEQGLGAAGNKGQKGRFSTSKGVEVEKGEGEQVGIAKGEVVPEALYNLAALCMKMEPGAAHSTTC